MKTYYVIGEDLGGFFDTADLHPNIAPNHPNQQKKTCATGKEHGHDDDLKIWKITQVKP